VRAALSGARSTAGGNAARTAEPANHQQMNKALYIVVLVASVTAAFVVGSQTGHLRASPPEAGRRVHHYACPMHPASTSDRPGTAPCCGMAYAPVYEEPARAIGTGGTAEPGTVHVPAGVRQAGGVQVNEVRAAEGRHAIRLFGRVAADEARVFALNAGIDGTIRELSPATTGSRVRKGQLLGTYTAPELLLAVQQFIVAFDGLERRSRGELAGAPLDEEEAAAGIVTASRTGLVIDSRLSNLQQRIDRLRLLGMSERQIDEIRRTKDIPAAIKILAPADGIVLSRNATAGRTFARGEEWFRIADLRSVWVYADVFGDDAAAVRPGMKARVAVQGGGGTLPARVSDVPVQYDPAARTRTIRLDVENAGDLLRPGMPVDVELEAAFEATVAIPAEAVVEQGLRRIVFVEREPGTYEPREVETGWRRGGQVQIARGLAAGERIVTAGTFLLDADARMRAASGR
jgi:Cu(I)/Ag(I) efflux system membrane fusion protein